MFNDVITLETESESTQTDAIGNIVHNSEETEHLCEERQIGRAEFYNAARAGLAPSVIVAMNAWEYDGQQKCWYGGKPYIITRTYKTDRDTVELTLSKKAGVDT